VNSLISILGVVLLLIVTPVLANEKLSELFAKIDQIKASDPAQFKVLLQQIGQYDLASNDLQYYLYLQGYHAQYLGEHDKAFTFYEKSLLAGNSIDIEYKVLALLSNLMTVRQNITAAFSYLFQAMALADKVSDPNLRPMAKVTALTTYMSMKLYQETQNISLELIEDDIQGRYRCVAIFYNDYSTQELTPDKVSLERLQKGADYCISQNDPLTALFAQALVARYYLFHQDYTQVEKVINAHLPAVEKLGFAHLIGHYYVLLTQAQLALNQPDSAEKTLGLLFTLQHQLSTSEPMVEGYRLKAQLDEIQGRDTKALLAYKQYVQADKIYKNTLSLQQTAYHLAKNEILNKNQQIALLEKNNTLLTLENELAVAENDNKKLLIALLLTTLVFISYVAFRAFRNSSIYRKIAENDSLLGISNRYYFTKTVSALLVTSKPAQQIDAFIIFDLDWFKQVNDRHGHLTGDWVLKAVVEHCRQFVRNVDVFGRIGGEEFAIFLPACTAEKAALLAEILRDVIEQIDCSGSGHPIKTSASFGVTCTDRSGYELRQLFRDADIALYLSKNQGRNKVTLFEPTQQKENPAAL
jgi:diguanylate cyclase